ncbi:MAG: KH domain-containing protein [Clostridiales bacterium]|nr:KH domain-containing protein [Clostridiales bacterium]MDD7308977.1 KH domain-containing protein [Eubacteriales bacterium]MDY5346027.1 KH domain-containing protein [Eubacteriales bacterium]
MKELLYYIVRQIVDHPDAVSINEVTRDDTLVLELSVDPSDMGKVIGRQGKIAKSIRSIVKAAAIRENIRVNVDIIG